MKKNIYDEYIEAKAQKNPTYNKVGLISLILSLLFLLIWIILTIIIKIVNNGLLQGTMIIIYFLLSFIINPIFLILSIFLLILQWKVTFNKFTLLSVISNSLLLISIILTIFLF